MKKVIYIIIYKSFPFIELCCSFCFYKNIHCGHKLLEITDEESLKKENITIEESIKEFDGIIVKANELKEKNEEQINEINNLYEKVNNEVIKSFLIKYVYKKWL